MADVYPIMIDGATYRVSVTNGVGAAGTDTTAIHDNVAGEISAITEKTSPADKDMMLIEDSADSNNKKKIELGSIPVLGPSATLSNGSGSPEGVLAASAGSLYVDTSGGTSTTLYVKESGTGNTGWIAK